MGPKIPTVKFSNGLDFPLFGLGTWQAKNAAELKTALDVAAELGYRHLDTAELYENEHIIGEWLDEKIKSGKYKRADFFITSKLKITFHSPEKAEAAIKKSLEDLKTDYIDLFLIHKPFAMETIGFNENGPDPAQCKPALIPHIDTWRVFEKYYKLGKLKSIGVSNFNQAQIDDLYAKAEIKPHNHQVECHVLLPQKELHEHAKKLNMVLTSYATMGSPGRPQKDANDLDPTEVPVVLEMAKKYNKTPSQILLRQMIQRGIAVIPKSTNPERLKQNIDIFDFELSPEDMAKFDEIKQKQWIFQAFWEKFAKHHPYYPFADYLK